MLTMVENTEKEIEPVAEERLMDRLIKDSPTPPERGALVEGTVISVERGAVYVDVPPFGTGIIFGREYLTAREIIKEIAPGDSVSATIVLPEGENGYIELSLKEARQALLWSEAKKALENKTPFELTVKDANKGGLILGWQGMDGFIPASQLGAAHYPKVPDGDKNKIMDELKKLVGQVLAVFVIGVDPKENKLIFSEKLGADQKERQDIVSQYNLGDVVEGEVTGIVDFGIFVKLTDNFEGLVHISEIDWGLVENPRDHYKPGDKVKVKIIEIKDGKVSLSIKALEPNPWEAAAKKYQKGQTVSGVVIKHNKHGALVSIEEGVAGLIHVSEFKSEAELREKLELGKTYDFAINLFEPKTHKMTLSLASK